MKIPSIFWIIILLLKPILLKAINIPIQITERTCILLNCEFKDYYLYASAKQQIIKSSQRPVALRKNSFNNKYLNDFTTEEKQGIWTLKHINGTLSTYYIINMAFDEYLFANEMGKLQRLLTRERSIKTDKMKSLEILDEKYMWNFKKGYNGMYEIWNVKFKERMFDFFLEKIKMLCFKINLF